jgi:hypothetical protein
MKITHGILELLNMQPSLLPYDCRKEIHLTATEAQIRLSTWPNGPELPELGDIQRHAEVFRHQFTVGVEGSEIVISFPFRPEA